MARLSHAPGAQEDVEKAMFSKMGFGPPIGWYLKGSQKEAKLTILGDRFLLGEAHISASVTAPSPILASKMQQHLRRAPQGRDCKAGKARAEMNFMANPRGGADVKLARHPIAVSRSSRSLPAEAKEQRGQIERKSLKHWGSPQSKNQLNTHTHDRFPHPRASTVPR